MSRTDNSVKHWRNLPFSIPKQISLMSMYVPSLVKIPWHLLKLSPGTENIGVSRGDNRQKLTKLAHLQSQTRSSQYQYTYQVWWKSINVYSSYHPETKYWRTDGRTTDGRLDGHTDVQRETIIPHHYRVAGYTKKHVDSLGLILQLTPELWRIVKTVSLSRLCWSPITAYLEAKIWSLFKHENLLSGNTIFWKRG